MKLYHASNVAVTKPDTVHSRNDIDFGKGFYLTTIQDQAIKYAQRFLRRRQSAWLNTYTLEYDPSEWNIQVFYTYNRDWLEFITRCRSGQDISDYDMVIGGIADDKVIVTLERYLAGEIDVNQALGLLVYEKPNIQFCIRSQEMLDKCLKHIESKML